MDYTKGWQIGIRTHASHTKEMIAQWALEAHGVVITQWEDALKLPVQDKEEDTPYYIALANVTDTIVAALRREGEWVGVAGDDEHGITIEIDAGDVFAEEDKE